MHKVVTRYRILDGARYTVPLYLPGDYETPGDALVEVNQIMLEFGRKGWQQAGKGNWVKGDKRVRIIKVQFTESDE
jgi:hypothetical protein